MHGQKTLFKFHSKDYLFTFTFIVSKSNNGQKVLCVALSWKFTLKWYLDCFFLILFQTYSVFFFAETLNIPSCYLN